MDIESIVEEYCIQIDELCDYIEDERKELLTLKNRKQCSNCFYEMEDESNYCPSCGDKQNQIEEDEYEEYQEYKDGQDENDNDVDTDTDNIDDIIQSDVIEDNEIIEDD